MSPFSQLLAVLAAVYGLLYLFDLMLRSFEFLPYVHALSSAGLELRLFQVRWYTKALNRVFTRIGRCKPGLMHAWFAVGAWVSALLLIPAMVLLVQTLVSQVVSLAGSEGGSASDGGGVVLQPVLPGVNMPLGELGYYFVTLLICSVIHEAGHAVAAVVEDVRVLGFGMFVFFALPAAHVDLPTDQLLALRASRQLRVFAAGIWHNVVLAAFAYLLLFSVPFLSAPLFNHGEGVGVAKIAPDSSVRGPTGLKVGDGISAINDCPVSNRGDWRSCLAQSIARPTFSVCIRRDLVASSDQFVIVEESDQPKSSVIECCDTEKASSNLCFVDDAAKSSGGGWKGHACLPVRNVLEKSHGRCNATSLCGDDFYCMRPSLANSSRLLQVLTI